MKLKLNIYFNSMGKKILWKIMLFMSDILLKAGYKHPTLLKLNLSG